MNNDASLFFLGKASGVLQILSINGSSVNTYQTISAFEEMGTGGIGQVILTKNNKFMAVTSLYSNVFIYEENDEGYY